MDDNNLSLDDLLCRSISEFRQFRLYDDHIKEENAFKLLREAEQTTRGSKDAICLAKLGCVIEYLAQRFYIANDTDIVLVETDEQLVSFKKELNHPSVDTFATSLWVGEYFLYRLKNPKSQSAKRSKKMIAEVLSYMAKSIAKCDKSGSLPFSFSSVLFEETVDWAKDVCDAQVCERQVVKLLNKLHAVQLKGSLLQHYEDGREGEKYMLLKVLRSNYM